MTHLRNYAMFIQRQAWILCLFTGTLLANTEARADEDALPPWVSVTGTGKISDVPDTAEISAGVITQAKTAREAMTANAEAMTALHDQLKERGVAAKDIQTVRFAITPRYAEPRLGPEGAIPPDQLRKIVGFQVENTVQITARQIEKLGTLLDALVEKGANQIRGLSFRIDSPEKLLDEARRRAIADAKRTAELLAGEAGVVLGPPLRINETGQNIPMPRMRNMNFFAGAAPTPIAEGEQELSVSVQVVYQLKQAK